MTAKNHQEIERRFLLRDLPTRIPQDCVIVGYEHGFLPGDLIRERVTKRVVDPKYNKRITPYKRTVKIGKGEVRQEFEEAIDQELFEKLWPITLGRRLGATRWIVPVHDVLLALDVEWEISAIVSAKCLTEVLAKNKNAWEPSKPPDYLYLAEIELPKAKMSVLYPNWLGPYVVREVTEEHEFEAWHLATGQS